MSIAEKAQLSAIRATLTSYFYAVDEVRKFHRLIDDFRALEGCGLSQNDLESRKRELYLEIGQARQRGKRDTQTALEDESFVIGWFLVLFDRHKLSICQKRFAEVLLKAEPKPSLLQLMRADWSCVDLISKLNRFPQHLVYGYLLDFPSSDPYGEVE